MSRKQVRSPFHGRSALSSGQRPALDEPTGAEASYLVQAIESKALVVIELLGGGELRGKVASHDRHTIELARDGAPPVLVRKAKIRCYWMERAAPRTEPPA